MTLIIANRYSVGQKIGAGGMGNVYRGEDQRTHTPIAVKVLRSELATPEIIARFIREGEALRQLNHPNIVMLLDAVEENAEHYLIMELVEGGALDEVLRHTPHLPIQQILNITLDLADALTRAHRLNIIHRDIKPANVLLTKDGVPRLTDFGIAHFTDSDITQTGTVMGTTAYIAPEVLEGELADVRSDIWSLGIMLYEMLAGEHPFKTTNPGALIRAILSQSVPNLEAKRPDTPVALIDLINRMVVRDPAERIPRMRLVGVELEALLAGEHAGSARLHSQDTLTIKDFPSSRFVTPSSVPAHVGRNNLPIQTTPFVGRENEISELEKLIHTRSVRLLTILAPGGMGKTRLSLELANRLLHLTRTDRSFEQGCFFVDLAPLTSAENMVQAVAEAVGYSFQEDGRQPKQQILDYLHEKNLLLIMDNFEHVMTGHTLVQDIIQVSPSVKILVTSREKLNLSAEVVFILEGMDFPTWETPQNALEYGAVKLFMQSARRVRSDFQLGPDDLPFVARICRMVYGVPLGILLAAAWLETLSLEEIVQELSRSLDFLESEIHDLPERQRSLRAVFEYSWNLLTESERALFARFSVFRGGFTREAGQQITEATLRTLTTMINKSLLRRDNTSGRFMIHELLRQYAEEKLIALGSAHSLCDAHSQYYLGVFAQLTPRLKGHGQLAALNTIEADFENIRTAWFWANEHRHEKLIHLALEGMYLFLTLRNRFMDGEQLFREARRAWSVGTGTPSLLAGQVLVRYPEHPQVTHLRRGLVIAQQHNDPFEVAFCQSLLGHWLSHTEFDQEEGIPMMEASLKGFEALGDKYYVAKVLDDLGWSHNLMMDSENQQKRVEQSLNLRREIGDQIGTANSLRNMGGAVGGFFDVGDRAVHYWREAKSIAYEMNDRLGVAWNASLEAASLMFQGEFDSALRLVDEGYPHAKDINDPVVKGFLQILRGALIALRDERYEQARALIEEGYPLQSPPDFRLTLAPFAAVIVCCGTGDIQFLQPYLKLGMNTPPFNHKEFYAPVFLPSRLFALAGKGQYARVVELLGAFEEATLSYAGYPFPKKWVVHWGLFTRLCTQLETELSPAAYKAAWERGRHITLDELADEAVQFS